MQAASRPGATALEVSHGYSMWCYATGLNKEIKNIEESPQRLDAGRETARLFGVEITDVYMTMGEYDMVARLEAPSDEAIAKYILGLGSRGAGRQH